MLELDRNVDDDPIFLDLAGQLIAGAALFNGLTDIVLVHVDHWFGPRWLGFCGKLLGVAGVRSRSLKGPLTPPPFHPHRILSAKSYRFRESKSFEYREESTSLHECRPSHDNIHRTLPGNTLYAWFSGNTTSTGRGIVMVYVVKRDQCEGWYIAFDKRHDWHLAQTVEISPNRVHEYIQCNGLQISK